MIPTIYDTYCCTVRLSEENSTMLIKSFFYGHIPSFIGKTIFVFCLALLALPCKLNASENNQVTFSADNPPYLENFVLEKSNQWVILSLTVSSPFDKKIKSLILNGVPQKITLTIDTNEKKNYLFLVNIDRKIFSNSITQSILYDNLKKLFVVNFDGKRPAFKTSSYKKALLAVSTFHNIHLLPLKKSLIHHDYQSRVKAEIIKKQMPFHLEYLFFFLASRDRKTQTYIIEIPQQFLPDKNEQAGY
ncbi:MAG TPA: DUF4390 domain-containing protein [Proteobacteria bacterium]|nr:DUF4390 domain-containing protein [Pseudomonadota bacterium]